MTTLKRALMLESGERYRSARRSAEYLQRMQKEREEDEKFWKFWKRLGLVLALAWVATAIVWRTI